MNIDMDTLIGYPFVVFVASPLLEGNHKFDHDDQINCLHELVELKKPLHYKNHRIDTIDQRKMRDLSWILLQGQLIF